MIVGFELQCDCILMIEAMITGPFYLSAWKVFDLPLSYHSFCYFMFVNVIQLFWVSKICLVCLLHDQWLTGLCKSIPVGLFFYISFVVVNCRDLGWQQRYARFCGRIVVLSVLVLLLYPFLWVWTVIGTLWFSTARGCVSSLILDISATCITTYS